MYRWSVKIAGDAIADSIRSRQLSIYDDLSNYKECWYEIETLEVRLNQLLKGLDLNFPIRTRAKVAKEKVAEALGYEAPRSFRKTQPRFPGQNLDIAVQMSNNFQVWNEEVDPLRRYGFIRVDDLGRVTMVRLLSGEAVAELDTTGTLTSKFQAKRKAGRIGSLLVSDTDTPNFRSVLSPTENLSTETLKRISPTARPVPELVLPIDVVWQRVQSLVGIEFEDPGLVQDRNRGVVLQKLVCDALGLSDYADAGQWPDILSQVIEVKFQLSPTIDLGLVSPDSQTPVDEAGYDIRHCDARYVVAYGSRSNETLIHLDSIVLTTGLEFFNEFQRFEGMIQNRKLQIPLPSALFQPKGDLNELTD